MGVKVERDSMMFPMDKDLPDELRLHFRAELSDDAPIGSINGRIGLIMVGAPYASIVRGVEIPLKGEVVGNLRAAPLNTLILTPTGKGQMAQTTFIYCTQPIEADALRVKTTNPNFLVRLLPAPQAEATQVNPHEEARQLEVTLKEATPSGRYKGQIIVFNTTNKQRLEMSVLAVATKPTAIKP